MNETGKTHDPLARLVLFMVCLALAGTFVAGAHYYAIDLPQQQNLQAPANAENPMIKCQICKSNCYGETDYYNCLSECDLICP